MFGDSWNPLSSNPSYSFLPMILATIYVSFLSIAIVMPLGIGCAFFLSFCVRKSYSKIIMSFIDILAGVPSVIFGFLGLILLVRFMEKHLEMGTATFQSIHYSSLYAAGLVLIVIILIIQFVAYKINKIGKQGDENEYEYEK